MKPSESDTRSRALLVELYRRETDRWLDWKSIEQSLDTLSEQRRGAKRREFIRGQRELSRNNLSTLQALLWPKTAERRDTTDATASSGAPSTWLEQETHSGGVTDDELTASVVFPGEFNRSEQLVAEYLGQAIAEATECHEVSRATLVSALAWVQIHLKSGAVKGWLLESTWVCELADESVGWAPDPVWEIIRSEYVSEAEALAAIRAVHERLARAIVSELPSDDEPGAPIVMVNRRLD